MLTDKYPSKRVERDMGITQFIYEFPNGYKASVVTGSILHSFYFAWEVAIMNSKGAIDYTTPLTEDVEVFMTDEETNDFLDKIAKL